MTGRRMLLDTASLYFRAFHGVPESITSPDGQPIGAVRGLLDMIAKLHDLYAPEQVIACWDDDWRPAWRVALVPSYKAHRVETATATGAPDIETVPAALLRQVPLIRDALTVLGIPIIGAAEHEADDVIGTLAARGTAIDVVTGDRDLFQVVDDTRDVRVVYTGRGMSKLEVLTDAAVVAKYGILPAQYADFAVLRGDPSDGLPGVAGVGDKTAATLLAAHGDLAGIQRAAEAGEGMSAGVRAKVLAAVDYLAVAPDVVRVATGLDLADPPREPNRPDREAADAFAQRWGLGGSMTRVLAALAA